MFIYEIKLSWTLLNLYITCIYMTSLVNAYKFVYFLYKIFYTLSMVFFYFNFIRHFVFSSRRSNSNFITHGSDTLSFNNK